MRLSHLTWPKAQVYFSEKDIALIAIGSIESHGRHLPLGTDTLIPDKLLDLIESKSDVLILPTIPYGATESLGAFPGSVDIGTVLLSELLGKITESLFRDGIRRFVVLNGHGGNVKAIDLVAYDLQKKGALLAELNWWLMAWDMNPAWKGGHGGGEETAGVMAVDPDLVDKSALYADASLRDLSETIKATGFNTVKFQGVTVNVPRLATSITDNGWIGPDHPDTATPVWGTEMLETCAQYIADFMVEFEKVDIQAAVRGL